MKIEKDCLVTLDFTLHDAEGNMLDATDQDDPLQYLHGHEQIVPGLEKELAGRQKGDQFKLTVAPEDAFGRRDEANIQEIDRDAFGDDTDLEVGMEFHADTPDGMQIVTITAVNGEKITVDANHPLADKTLCFDATVKEVEKPSPDMIEKILSRQHHCDCGCEDDAEGSCQDGCGCGH